MEVILKQEVENLGVAHELVTVKAGYGRNYLIPRGLAVLATTSARKVHAENLKQRAHKEEKVLKEAQSLAEKLEGVVLSVGAKAGTSGKIFGSVNSIQIAEAFEADLLKKLSPSVNSEGLFYGLLSTTYAPEQCFQLQRNFNHRRRLSEAEAPAPIQAIKKRRINQLNFDAQ